MRGGFCFRSIFGLLLAAVGVGVLAAFIFPLWFLVIAMASLLVCLGLSCFKF